VHRSTSDVATAQFFGKCTQEAIETIIEVARHFIAHLKNRSATESLKKQNIVRRLVLLLQLLDHNLSNFEPRRKSQNDDVLTSQPSIIDFLSRSQATS
jgi:hypothetical protein